MIKFLTPFILLVIASNSYPKSIIDRDFSEFIKNFPSIEKSIKKDLTTENKIKTYNIHSGKVIENVSKKAVDNSPALIPATAAPTATPTIIPEPLPTMIFIPITETPYPTPPERCIDIVCPMIACIDNLEVQSMKFKDVVDCPPCPCVPPPIY